MKAVGTINITPTWVAAARIYLMVLANPKADADAHLNAEAGIMEMAQKLDALIAEKED